MHREHTSHIWLISVGVIGLVLLLLVTARLVLANHVLSNYLEDIAGAITVIVLSIATYEEWESRRELGRYKVSEGMGIRRIKDEVFQLLYQYAFVLNMRWNPDSEAMKTIETLTMDSEFSYATTELHAKTAKHISQEDPTIESTLFAESRQALSDVRLSKQTYRDADDLITQTERAIEQIDMAIAIYGYAFAPETHEWALRVREDLNQCIVGKLSILSIRLSSVSKYADKTLRRADQLGIAELVPELIKVGTRADRVVPGKRTA